jgi:hypothetical protein
MAFVKGFFLFQKFFLSSRQLNPTGDFLFLGASPLDNYSIADRRQKVKKFFKSYFFNNRRPGELDTSNWGETKCGLMTHTPIRFVYGSYTHFRLE